MNTRMTRAIAWFLVFFYCVQQSSEAITQTETGHWELGSQQVGRSSSQRLGWTISSFRMWLASSWTTTPSRAQERRGNLLKTIWHENPPFFVCGWSEKMRWEGPLVHVSGRKNGLWIEDSRTDPPLVNMASDSAPSTVIPLIRCNEKMNLLVICHWPLRFLLKANPLIYIDFESVHFFGTA